MRIVWIIVGCLLCLSSGCGGGAASTAPMSSGAPSGTMRMLVGKRTPRVEHPLAQVQQFRVVVTTADGTEYVREVDADATAAEFPELPADAEITVTVEGRNADAQAVERGHATARIRGGESTDVDLMLQQVPIFTNVRDGAVVAASQLRPEVLAAPGGTVRITPSNDGAPLPDLVDLSLGRADVPVGTAGTVQVRPTPLAAGRYQLRVEDVVSGESSDIHVVVIDRTHRPAALYPLVSGDAARGNLQRAVGFVPTPAAVWPLVRRVSSVTRAAE